MKPPYVVVVLCVAVLISCGSGGGDEPSASFTQFTPSGYPLVAGDYTVTTHEQMDNCGPVDSTPRLNTFTVSQNEDEIMVINHGEAAALEAAGYTIDSISPLAGAVTKDGHLSLSQVATMTHSTFGTVGRLSSFDGIFTATGGSGTQEVQTFFVVAGGLGSSCASSYTLAAEKAPPRPM